MRMVHDSQRNAPRQTQYAGRTLTPGLIPETECTVMLQMYDLKMHRLLSNVLPIHGINFPDGKLH